MSQAQILHPQRSCGQPQDFRHQFPLLQPGGQYTPHSFGPSQQQLHHFASTQMMAQPMQATMQHQYRPEELQQRRPWTSQQQFPASLKSSLNMHDAPSQGYAMAVAQYWGNATGRDQSNVWDSTQIVVPDSNRQFLQNNNLMYNADAAQHMAAQHHSSYGGQLSWTPSAMRAGVAGMGASISDFDSINSLSPQSYLSDGVEVSFSPCSVPDQASQCDWSVSPPSAPIKVSSPQLAPSFLHSSLVAAHNNSLRRCTGTPGLLCNDQGIPASSSSTQPGQFARVPASSFNDGHQSSPDGSLISAESSKTSWYMSDYSPSQSSVKLAQQNGSAYEAQPEGNIGASSTSNDSFSSRPSTSAKGSHNILRPQSNYQARFQVPQTSDVQAQRQRNDDLLIEGKRAGLTYREIRKKMLGEKPAESTLRGRYRSLTKARKDRVRKPVWHRRDIELLNGYVGRELERIEKSLSNPNAASTDQKLIKVRWKEVADYIHDNGGSYHFGNSTCKRKWKELNSPAK